MASISRATISYGWSASGMKCSTPSSRTATGSRKSRVRAAPVSTVAGVPQIGLQVIGGPLRAAGQQGPGVADHHRIVVHVDDPRLRRGLLRDLVGVVGRRQAGADVQELADAVAAGQQPHRVDVAGAARAGPAGTWTAAPRGPAGRLPGRPRSCPSRRASNPRPGPGWPRWYRRPVAQPRTSARRSSWDPDMKSPFQPMVPEITACAEKGVKVRGLRAAHGPRRGRAGRPGCGSRSPACPASATRSP